MREQPSTPPLVEKIFSGPLTRSQYMQVLYLLDNAPELVFVRDNAGRFTYLNKIGAKQFGVDRSGLNDAPVSLNDVVSEEGIKQIALEEVDFANDPRPVAVEGRYLVHGAGARWYNGTKVPLLDEAGALIGVAGIFRDVTELKRQETIRRDHANLLEMIARGQALPTILERLVRTVEGMLDNVIGSILLYDPADRKLCHGAAPSLPQTYSDLIDGIEIGPKVGSCGTAAYRREPVYVSDTMQDPLWEDFRPLAMRHGLRACWSTPIFATDGALLGTFALYAKTVREPDEFDRAAIDMATNIASIAIDNSRTHEKAQFMAHHDALTGLYNRNLFWSQFGRSIEEAKREDRMVAITYIDLDNFKQINDEKGHAAGDRVLTTVANRIRGAIRSCDIPVRLGGDEFAIIFSNQKHDREGIMARLESIRDRIAAPIAFEGKDLDITCSIGVAFFDGGTDTPEDLLAMADSAMYAAKNSGRNRVKTFDPSLWDM